MSDIDPLLTPRPGRRFQRWEYVVVLLGLSLLAVLTFPAHTLGSARLFTRAWLDAQSSEFAAYPWDCFAREQLSQGEIPLWNPREAGGSPFVANYQSSLFYPLKAIVYATNALDVYLLVRLVVGGLFLYRFLRFLRLSRAASTLGTFSFTLSSYFLLFLNLPHVNAEVLIPLVLYTLAAFIRFGGAGRFLAAALSVTVVVFGGHPEATFYVLLFAGGYGCFEGLVAGRGLRPIPVARRVLGGPLVLVCGVLMGAIQILPFLEYLGHAWHIHAPGVGGIHRDALGFVEFVTPRVRPGSYDFPMGVGSVALMLALYAVAGIRRVRARAVFFAFVPLCFVGLYLGVWPFSELGRLPFIGEAGNIKYPAPVVNASLAVLAAIGFDRLRSHLASRCPCRALYGLGGVLVGVGLVVPIVGEIVLQRGWDLGACALAAGLVIGVLLFVRMRQKGVVAAPGCNLSILASTLAALWASHAGVGHGLGWGLAALAVAAPLLLWVVPRARPWGWRGSLVPATAILIAVGGVHAREAFTHVASPPFGQRLLPDPDRPPEFLAVMRKANENMGGGPFRIAGDPVALPANQATVYGIEDVRAFDALYVDRFFQYLNVINALPDYREVLFPLPARITLEDALARLQASDTDWRFFEQTKRTAIKLEKLTHPLVHVLGVRFFLYGPYHAGAIVEGDGYRTIYDQHGFRVVANDHALPRAFLVHSVEVQPDRASVKKRLGEAGFDGRSVALLEADPPGPVFQTGAAGPDEQVRVDSRGIHHVHVDVVAREPGVLVVTDNYYPGWVAERVEANGDVKRADLFPCDLAFRGVYVPAGHHVVRLTYRPGSFRLGAALSGFVLLALVMAWLGPRAWAGLTRLRRGRQRRSERPRSPAGDEA